MMALPRHAELWLADYLWGEWRRIARPRSGEGRLWVMIGDHYEPLWAGADEELGRRRVAFWRKRWPEIAARFQDSAGQPPQYTFFYPQDEYRPFFVEPLAEMARAGIGDVEVHIHHDEHRHPAEGKGTFLERMSSYLETLEKEHGLLRRHNGKAAFGFIHGVWALDNSQPNGAWCGLNNEITLLRDLGCYADFTMPAPSSPAQARTLNRIYWAIDDPDKPRSHDYGVTVLPGRRGSGDLLMIPGPLGLRWRSRLVPRMESGELAGHDLPDAYRVERWLDLAPCVGRDVFLKLYTHGAQEANSRALLEGGLETLYTLLPEACARRGWELRYATAWQLYQAVIAAA